MQNDPLEYSQALDLVHYFLGPNFTLTAAFPSSYAVFDRTTLVAYAQGADVTWETVLRRAGAWPSPPQFSAAKQDVKRGSETVARAMSSNLAKRIANALNCYTPDKRGQ